MTDEQWVWLYANRILDEEEKLDSMCPSCKDEATDRSRCSRCGKDLPTGSRNDIYNPNPNFDMERFKKLAEE